ncbi:hypothetical protein [Psychromonas aquimarina]|uniref:hypothetical protein n=1 Tax=Psychromonas aquimarina TaxID=444919 RepID=UPI00048FD833|nr:hypothetical protein [Psychromonas aquimarina]
MHPIFTVSNINKSLGLKKLARAASVMMFVGMTTACATSSGPAGPAAFNEGIFVDTMANLDLAMENSGNLQFEQGDDYDRFGGDTDRVLRKYNDAETITYLFDNDIKTVIVDSFFWRNEMELGVEDFSIEVSSDGENYMPLDLAIDEDENIYDHWQQVTYTGTTEEAGNKYLRITFPISLNDTNGWAPQLGNLTVSSL